MIECDCEKFEAGMKAINGPITLQSVRSGGRYQFNQDYIFLFCPWCGIRLPKDCIICGDKSNSETGNTVYWIDNDNFCSAACASK